jgi:hypothetical protein
VVPESPTAQDSPTEEQQPEDHGTEDKTNEEHPPPSDTEPEKMYRDADEVESFGAESLILTGRVRALLEHLGITTAPRYWVKEVPRSGQMEFKAIAEIFFGSRILCRHKGPAFRTSRSNAATIRGYRRMVDGQASDLYASNTNTWTATSLVQSSSKEPAVSSHSPSGSRSR